MHIICHEFYEHVSAGTDCYTASVGEKTCCMVCIHIIQTRFSLSLLFHRVECEYSGVVAVRELLTGLEAHIRMTASTTSDEVHATNFS